MANNSNQDPNMTSAQLKFQELMLNEVRGGMNAVREDVRNYRDETVRLTQKLDDHILTCDKRYAAKVGQPTPHMPTPVVSSPEEHGSALISKRRVMKVVLGKILEKAVDYGVMVTILIVAYAFSHGFKLPMPW